FLIINIIVKPIIHQPANINHSYGQDKAAGILGRYKEIKKKLSIIAIHPTILDFPARNGRLISGADFRNLTKAIATNKYAITTAKPPASTSHTSIGRPNNGLSADNKPMNRMERVGVPYFGRSLPNQAGISFFSAVAYKIRHPPIIKAFQLVIIPAIPPRIKIIANITSLETDAVSFA